MMDLQKSLKDLRSEFGVIASAVLPLIKGIIAIATAEPIHTLEKTV